MWFRNLLVYRLTQDIPFDADALEGEARITEGILRTMLDDVIEAAPEVMLASWCGKPLDRAAVLARPRSDEVPAIRAGRIHELPPEIILQPGPACLTDGLDRLETVIHGLEPRAGGDLRE